MLSGLNFRLSRNLWLESRIFDDASIPQRGQTDHGRGCLRVLCLAGARPQRHHRRDRPAHQHLGRQGQRPEHRRPDLPDHRAAVHRRPAAAESGGAGARGLPAGPGPGLGPVRPEQRARREYRRRGIKVSEDEIVQAIRNSPLPEFQSVPEFQTDSQFDLGKYQRWLTSSVAQQYLPSLEAQYREELQRAKLLRVVTADVYLSDAALWEQYRDENEKVKIGLTAIVPRNVVPDSAVTVSRRRDRPRTTRPTRTSSSGRAPRT